MINPATLLAIGTRVRHTVADDLTGIVSGYGFLSYGGSPMQPVYIVQVDQVAPLKTRVYSSVSMISMNINHVVKENT